MITRIIIGVVLVTIVLFVWAWCAAAGDADRASEQAEIRALEANRHRLRSQRKHASGTRR